MTNTLIGYSGFVGSTLLRQRSFEGLYRSTNIGDIDGTSHDLVICAAAPAQMWIANKDPEGDRAKIDSLISHLEKIKAKTFILISTVGVFRQPLGVYEDTSVEEGDLLPYGVNRYHLEKFVTSHFSNAFVVRLAGLVGPGLRKNVIMDFRNNNNLHAIDSRGIHQYYPMVNLWGDLQTAMKHDLRLLHLTSAPISVAEVAREGFGVTFDQQLTGTPANYDFRTRHAALFGGHGDYQYSKRETLLAIRSYAQSEPLTLGKAVA